MDYELHDILDDAGVALYAEGVSELKIRNAVVMALRRLAMEGVGQHSELVPILDTQSSNREILDDLKEYNAWETPNRRDPEDALGTR